MDKLKRIPKWAWFVAAGIVVGGVALRTMANKRAADDSEAGTSGTDPATGQAVGTAPPGVIVPPVIMGGGGEQATIDPIIGQLYGDLGSTFTTGFGRVLDTADRLAWDPGSIIQLLANAGGSPNPASQEPVVINVTPAAPAPMGPSVPAPAAAKCPAGFPNGNPPNCYKNCGHDECGSNKRLRRDHGHCYQDGHRQHVRNEDLGKKC